jgi:hypothetical protein
MNEAWVDGRLPGGHRVTAGYTRGQLRAVAQRGGPMPCHLSATGGEDVVDRESPERQHTSGDRG